MLFRGRQQIVICVVAGAIVGGFVLFRYLPLQQRIEAVESLFVGTQIAVAKASAEGEQLPALKEQLLGLQRTVGSYEVSVPCHRNLGVFLRQIADLMDEHNLKEQLVAPGEEIKGDVLNCIAVKMECKGKLTQIFEFYRRLQKLDRLVRVEQVRLVNGSDFGDEASMQTKAIIYYRPDEN